MIEDGKSLDEAKRRFREIKKETEEAAKKITKEVRDAADTVTGKSPKWLLPLRSSLVVNTKEGWLC